MDNLVYLKNKKNDKLFIRIDRDLLEMNRYVEGKYQSWFTANAPTDRSQTPTITTQVLRLENICLVDGSWISIGLQRIWIGLERYLWSNPHKRSYTKIIHIAFRVKSARLGNGKHVTLFGRPRLWN